MALLLIDVDFFKQYNDTHGHQGGDNCLKNVAEAIATSVLRETDMAARFGGEEFAVILPATPLKGALAVAENIRANLHNRFIFHGASQVSLYVTASIGIATSAGLTDVAELIRDADAALYRAKKLGRNRIEPSREEEPRNDERMTMTA